MTPKKKFFEEEGFWSIFYLDSLNLKPKMGVSLFFATYGPSGSPGLSLPMHSNIFHAMEYPPPSNTEICYFHCFNFIVIRGSSCFQFSCFRALKISTHNILLWWRILLISWSKDGCVNHLTLTWAECNWEKGRETVYLICPAGIQRSIFYSRFLGHKTFLFSCWEVSPTRKAMQSMNWIKPIPCAGLFLVELRCIMPKGKVSRKL